MVTKENLIEYRQEKQDLLDDLGNKKGDELKRLEEEYKSKLEEVNNKYNKELNDLTIEIKVVDDLITRYTDDALDEVKTDENEEDEDSFLEEV